MGKTIQKFMGTILLLVLVIAFRTDTCFAKTIIVTIDPGHGGNSASGAYRLTDQGYVYEKDLNLTIAKALKKELETYEGVKVYMTRKTDVDISLEDRVNYAKKKKSDLMISIHNNAKGDAQEFEYGSSVLISRGNYRPKLAKTEKKIGTLILKQLEKKAGTTNQGFTLRDSGSNVYPNGTTADYYAIIRQATLVNMPAMIVEHAFMDHDKDYTSFLSTPSKLRALGKADATGIAKYYKLQKKSR